MTSSAVCARFPRSERLLSRLASAMPGTVPAGRAEEDLELSARRVSRLLAAKVEEGDLDSLLELLENMLEEQERGEQAGRGTEARGPERGRRPRDVDPYFWG